MEEVWTFADTTTNDLPAGKYYVGDVCHSIRQTDVYYEISCLDGLYESKDGLFVIMATAKGNGIYVSSDQNDFVVTSGTIGIISESLLDADMELSGGVMYDFPTGLTVTMEDGVLLVDSEEQCFKLSTQKRYKLSGEDWM